MTDLSTTLSSEETTTEPVPPVAVSVPGMELPAGVHPGDQSVPVEGGQLVEPDKPPMGDPGPQGRTRAAPWSQTNEEALPVNQRSAHDWTAESYTVNNVTGPITISGRKKGQKSVLVWVPTGSAHGVTISPNEGDIQQGAGIVLSPGDPLVKLDTEGPVWCGVISGQAAGGPVNVVTLYDPPGGGLGLSST